jgi:hypothetical protein
MASFRLDLPTGATIVCTFGIALAIMAVVWALLWRKRAATMPVEVEQPGS